MNHSHHNYNSFIKKSQLWATNWKSQNKEWDNCKKYYKICETRYRNKTMRKDWKGSCNRSVEKWMKCRKEKYKGFNSLLINWNELFDWLQLLNINKCFPFYLWEWMSEWVSLCGTGDFGIINYIINLGLKKIPPIISTINSLHFGFNNLFSSPE